MDKTDSKVLLKVNKVSKKFCRDLRLNMIYGIKDVLVRTFGLKEDFTQLRKGEFWALKKINFTLEGGDILGIVGENGSGKTTLMRLISDVYPTEVGEILFKKNAKVTSIFALRSGMHHLFTGRENIYLKASMYGLNKEQTDERMAFIESFSELGEAIDAPFGNYSSGMKSRLSFAIAAATDPNIFIIDEALSVGDSEFKAKCFDFFLEFVQQPDKAILFVTNNVRKIQKIANRLIVLGKGKMLYETRDIDKGIDYYLSNLVGDEDDDEGLERLKKYNL